MPKKLIVNGRVSPVPVESPATTTDFDDFQRFSVDQTILVSNSRSLSTRHELLIGSDEDIVELQFEDKTTWIGNAQEFQEIFQASLNRGLDPETLEVPAVLQAANQRGVVQDLALRAFSLLKPKAKKLVGSAVQEIARRIEEKVQPQPGLSVLDAGFHKRPAGVLTDTSRPYLLFLHGTNSNTEGAFGGLVEKPDHGLWKALVDTYGSHLLTFDHKTLTESPLSNARALLEALPAGITLHLITHSRGGLVGDLLARASVGNTVQGFSEGEMELLKARAADMADMQAINVLARAKQVRVEKFIRVASPSMGTSLLADRLDHYLNALLNLIGVGTGLLTNPVYVGVKTLLSEVAASRSDISVLPGLEAMSPESPFLKMLNNPANILETPLIVIAGHCRVHAELKALLVILSKLYFRRKNDMVVDTWSMYFGTPRRRPVQFFLDDQQGTDHTHYFRSKASQVAMIQAIQGKEEALPGFQTLDETDIAEANRNAALPFVVSEVPMTTVVSGKKPIAILLPGIMGSSLYREDDRIWVDFWQFVKGGLMELAIETPAIQARSLVGSGYRRLARFLEGEGYDVVPYAYDWRKDLSDEALQLDALLATLLTHRQPIHVIAHSMGGVLFREVMLLNRNWAALNATAGFKALFLGAPLGGSYLIPETLSGQGGNLSKLSLLDLKHGKQDLLRVFSACPGLYNLLPLADAPHDFGTLAAWKAMFQFTGGLGVEPPDEVLEKFRAFRERAAQPPRVTDYRNIFYVAGQDEATTATYVVEDSPRGKRLVFKSTPEGDGSVTWASGIPAVLKESNAVYYSRTTHGELANDPSLFQAFLDLLRKGQTTRLRKNPPPVTSRATTKLFDNPRYELVPITARNIEAVVLGIPPLREEAPGDEPLRISVSNGDLRDASFPLMVGHFFRDGILGAERVLDSNFNGRLHEKLAMGVYPGSVGTSDVFLSYKTAPKGAIIIGLGEPDGLNGYKLEQSVAHGVSKFLLALREFEQENPAQFNRLFSKGIGISTVIVGGGYGGLSIENSIKSIILGIQKSNDGIEGLDNLQLRKVTHVEFVELYEDRALQAFYTLRKLEEDSQLNIVLPRARIKTLFGVRKRVPFNEQQDWWQRISVSIKGEPPNTALTFSASTGAAREEVRNLHANPLFIQEFVKKMSRHSRWSPSQAKAIFELLIPNDFKDAVRNQNNIVWKLDAHTAAYPWELLQDTAVQSKPLCVNAGMVRQLSTSDFRTQVIRSYKPNALVIGDPLLEGYAPQLPGAAREAGEVGSLLEEQGYLTTRQINGSSAAVIQSLLQDEYKIIHLAGHGDFDPAHPGEAGMLIGNSLFLTAREMNQVSQVPEFVFVNCCHLGKIDAVAEERAQQFYRLAANLGTQLIQMGVKAVIAAGWAVDDEAALLFARVFYGQMFEGAPFGYAVKAARTAAYRDFPDTNTWGAYQCYGDQFYTFKAMAPAKKREKQYILPMEIEVDLVNISNKVESGRIDKKEILAELRSLSEAIDKSGLRDGNLTEQEAQIYAALNEKAIAIEKISSLRTSEVANFSVKSLERLCNLHIKQLKITDNATPQDVQAVIADFELLIKIGATSERLCLLGSACKTLFEKSSELTDQVGALERSAASYRQGFEVAQKNSADILYPLCNWLQIESILLLLKEDKTVGWGKSAPAGYPLPTVSQAFAWMDNVLNLEGRDEADLDFWHLMDEPNVLLTKLCMNVQKGPDPQTVAEAIQKAWAKGGSVIKKQSELDHLLFLIRSVGLSQNAAAQRLAAALMLIFSELDSWQG